MMKGFQRRSYYGKNHVATTRGGTAPEPKKQINSFEQDSGNTDERCQKPTR